MDFQSGHNDCIIIVYFFDMVRRLVFMGDE